MFLKSFLLCLSSLAITGCATSGPTSYAHLPGPTPVVEKKSKMGNMKSYVIRGKRYHVMSSAEGYEETGTASWYGEPFHGRKTSNGETYNMYAMTAAHKTLPLPTYLLVTNNDNGKQVIVRVNDRGPFHGDRIVDLSYKAAKELGFSKQGTANVTLQAVTEGESAAAGKGLSPSEKLDLDRRWLYVQIKTMTDMQEAEALKAKLDPQITQTVEIYKPWLTNGIYVKVGPVKGIDNARLLRKQMIARGFKDAFVEK